MNRLCRNHRLITLMGVATILSLLRNFLSTRRAISSSQDFYLGNDDAPYVSISKLHSQWDDRLETRYSTTDHRIRGQVSFFLNDNDEINDGNNDFQHKGILRTSSEKHGKWMKIRFAKRDIEFKVAGETVHKSGANYSKYVDDMRLVIDANHSIMFPSIEMKDMTPDGNENHYPCYILRVMTNQRTLGVVPKVGIPPVVLNVTADCDFVNEKVNGQGNTILLLYGLRMMSALGKVDFEFQCNNNDFKGGSRFDNPKDFKKEKSRKLRWVFPWFASFQPAADENDPWPYTGDAPSQDQICSSWNSDLDISREIIPLEKMADQIRNDVQKMALQLVGSRTDDPKRIHPLIPLDVKPWIPNITSDDIIIHFPCYSDITDWKAGTTRRRSRVGIMQFTEYTKYIKKNPKTIGIIRESSGNSTEDVCHRASTLLLEYLTSFYSNHPVSISIYENDTLPLQYARIAMAQQSFSSFSAFGMIPIIGTFGRGYFQVQPPGYINPATTSETAGNQQSIIQKIVSGEYEGFENINLMNGNVLSPEKIATMSFSELSNWLLKSSP